MRINQLEYQRSIIREEMELTDKEERAYMSLHLARPWKEQKKEPKRRDAANNR